MARHDFVAYDGEGVTVGGEHKYITLQCSDGDEDDAISDPAGLSSTACFDFLYRTMLRYPGRIHVGFGLGYDVNMWLRDVSRESLGLLWRGERAPHARYRLLYRSRKSFGLSRARWNGAKWMPSGGTIWDTFGFFQSSFVDALESYEVGVPSVWARIRAMKAQRSVFHIRNLPAIMAYCADECRLLVELMRRVARFLGQASLSVQRWDGAGAVAAALLRREGVKPHVRAALPPPAPVQRASQHAYAGGRIECVRYGDHAGTIYRYDLRSAYPAALATLPSFGAGRWTRQGMGERAPTPWTMYRVRWDYRAADERMQAFPLFWRAPDGSIYYPPIGEGWYWEPEVRAACAAGRAGYLAGELRVLESWSWTPDDSDARPFAFIPKLYELRARWKRERNGAEKMLKLGLNSLYGKTAQHIGGKPGEAPAWHNLAWAGLTTSITRAALYRASLVALAEESLVMYATDALFTTRPLALPEGQALGAWEASAHATATIVQSGVYWLGRGADVDAYYRGFDDGTVKRWKVRAAWKAGRATARAWTTRFIGMGLALRGGKGERNWRHWVRESRDLYVHANTGKRAILPGTPTPARPDLGLVLTAPADPWHIRDRHPMSAPIALPWSPLGVAPDTLSRTHEEILE